MKYCTKCGREICDEAIVCIGCGCAVGNGLALQNQDIQTAPKNQDAPSLGYAFLGFFVPIVGLVLYLIWKDEAPKRAASAGKGALISFIISIVFTIIFVIFYVFLFALLMGIYM